MYFTGANFGHKKMKIRREKRDLKDKIKFDKIRFEHFHSTHITKFMTFSLFSLSLS